MIFFFYFLLFFISFVFTTYIFGFKNYKIFLISFILITSSCLGLYFLKGSPKIFNYQEILEKELKNSKDIDPQKLIIFLEGKLKKNPQDPEGWMILARTCLLAGYLQKADLYYSKAIKIFPNDKKIIEEYKLFKKEFP